METELNGTQNRAWVCSSKIRWWAERSTLIWYWDKTVSDWVQLTEKIVSPKKVCKKELPAQSTDSDGKLCTGQGIERTTGQDVYGFALGAKNITSCANFVQDHSSKWAPTRKCKCIKVNSVPNQSSRWTFLNSWLSVCYYTLSLMCSVLLTCILYIVWCTQCEVYTLCGIRSVQCYEQIGSHCAPTHCHRS